MLRLLSHTLHLLGEAVLGLLGLAALASCVLAWRLSQGPIDITFLVQREHRLLDAKGSHVTIGQAALAWEGFARTGQPLDIAVADVAAQNANGSATLHLQHARVALSLPQLLLGRIAPSSVSIEGATVTGSLGQGLFPAASQTPDSSRDRTDLPPWLRQLDTIELHDARLTLQGVLPGAALQAQHVALHVSRAADGNFAGTAHAQVIAGSATASLDVQAIVRDGATQISATTGAVSPAALAGLAPGLAPLLAFDAPTTLAAQASFGPALRFQAAHLQVSAGAGLLRAGQGSVALASLSAAVSLVPNDARLDRLKLVLAPLNGPTPHEPGTTGAAPPVLTATMAATRDPPGPAGRVHATFSAGIDGVAMADLPRYWPEGTGGGARDWLTQNVPAGRAHDAHVTGTLDGQGDLSDLALTALAGTVSADDLTLFWLRPVPALEHVQAKVTIEGPDALRVVVESGGQNNLLVTPGSSIRVTGLSKAHQFADIDAGLSGGLSDALGLLNHPRLNLLSRSGMDIVGAAGQVSARLTMHIPLEDSVTMDDIAIAASAKLHDVHLGRIAAGRDLDHAELALKVTGDGLSASGTGTVSGIAADLGLDMDFRNGPPSQVLQHVTASGQATGAQLAAAGLPDQVTRLITAGAAGLQLDYAGSRNQTAKITAGIDLRQAAMTTPLGWSKPVGQAASLDASVSLADGRITGVDRLQASGPGLQIVSRAEISGGGKVLVLDQLQVGRTRAHGRIAFPARPDAALNVTLSGDFLDLSSQLDPVKPATPAPTPPPTPPPAPPDDTKRGQPWSAKLDFAQVELSRGKVLAPFRFDAASDGLRIAHANVVAGTQNEVLASITPQPGGRAMSVTAADAGVALRSLGMADNLAGGRLQLTGVFDDTQPGSPLTGTATLTDFNLRDAPAIGRLLQAMTLYGLTDVARGPGLHFSRLVAPFRWRSRVLTLKNARAFSASLGVTAQGDFDLRRHTANITGTVVPAYFFNQLLGNLPLVGRIFSPEKGGGLFAARYSVRGPLANPKVGVNPLSALTPGFLREGFGLFSSK